MPNHITSPSLHTPPHHHRPALPPIPKPIPPHTLHNIPSEPTQAHSNAFPFGSLDGPSMQPSLTDSMPMTIVTVNHHQRGWGNEVVRNAWASDTCVGECMRKSLHAFGLKCVGWCAGCASCCSLTLTQPRAAAAPSQPPLRSAAQSSDPRTPD